MERAVSLTAPLGLRPRLMPARAGPSTSRLVSAGTDLGEDEEAEGVDDAAEQGAADRGDAADDGEQHDRQALRNWNVGGLTELSWAP